MKSKLLTLCGVLFLSSMAIGQTVCVPHRGNIILSNVQNGRFVVQEKFNYFIGAPLVAQTLVTQQVKDLKEYKEYLEFKQWQAQKQKVQKVQTTKSLLIKNCTSCHSGGEPKGGLVIDDKSTFTSAQFTKLSKWLTKKANPPGEMKAVITKVQTDKNGLLGNIISEFLDRVK